MTISKIHLVRLVAFSNRKHRPLQPIAIDAVVQLCWLVLVLVVLRLGKAYFMVSQKTDQIENLTSVALELFKARSLQPGINPQRIAVECLRDARSFLQAADDFLSGKSQRDLESSPLDDAFAPNLKKTHPINLMSSTWGDLKQVERILDELAADPSIDSYTQFGWGKSEINQARVLFPSVVNRVKQFQQAK